MNDLKIWTQFFLPAQTPDERIKGEWIHIAFPKKQIQSLQLSHELKESNVLIVSNKSRGDSNLDQTIRMEPFVKIIVSLLKLANKYHFLLLWFFSLNLIFFFSGPLKGTQLDFCLKAVSFKVS